VDPACELWVLFPSSWVVTADGDWSSAQSFVTFSSNFSYVILPFLCNCVCTLKALNCVQWTAQTQPSSTTLGFLCTAGTDLVCHDTLMSLNINPFREVAYFAEFWWWLMLDSLQEAWVYLHKRTARICWYWFCVAFCPFITIYNICIFNNMTH